MSAMNHNHPEATDRLKKKTWSDKPSWQPKPDQAAQILEIQQWQEREGCLDAELAGFTMHKGKPHDSSTWFKIRTGTYKGKDGTHLLENFKAACSKCAAHRAFMASAAQDKFFPSKWFKAFRLLVITADQREGVDSQERLVTLVGPTGQGKSRACIEIIKERRQGVVVHGLPSWRASYKSILVSLCEAFQLETTGTGNELQLRLVAELKQNRHTLYLEELSKYNVSPKLAELLLLMLNGTRLALVLAINPEGFNHLLHLYDTSKRHPKLSDGSAQLLRRGRVLAADGVDVAQAREFLGEQFAADPGLEVAAELLSLEASRLGGCSLVKEVVTQLADKGKPLSEGLVADVIARYKSRWQNPCRSLAA